MKETADTIGEYFSNLAGAMTDLIGAANERRQEQLDEQLEQTIEALDAQMQAELEALGLQEETEMESLQRQLKEAEDAGDAETAAELRDQIDRLTITQKYDKLEAEETKRVEKEKAQIEYEAELQQWQWQMAQALADAARAIVNIWSTWAWNPIVAGIMTGVTAAVTGIQIAAIEEARPSPPKFETGGIVLPSGKSGGTLVDVAEGGSSELLLNDSPAGKAMLRSFAAEIVGEMVAQMTLGTLVLPLQVDADVLGKVITQLTFTKQARVNKGAIVG
jgi:hypothetical protein